MNAQKLYVAASSSYWGTKIGISISPQDRMSGLGRHPVSLAHVEQVPSGLNPRDVEKLAHKLADSFRHPGEREWFDITPEQAIEVVQLALFLAKEHQATISWTHKIQIPLTTKKAIEELSRRDGIPIPTLLGNLLQEAITARSTA